MLAPPLCLLRSGLTTVPLRPRCLGRKANRNSKCSLVCPLLLPLASIDQRGKFSNDSSQFRDSSGSSSSRIASHFPKAGHSSPLRRRVTIQELILALLCPAWPPVLVDRFKVGYASLVLHISQFLQLWHCDFQRSLQLPQPGISRILRSFSRLFLENSVHRGLLVSPGPENFSGWQRSWETMEISQRIQKTALDP